MKHREKEENTMKNIEHKRKIMKKEMKKQRKVMKQTMKIMKNRKTENNETQFKIKKK